MPKEDDKKKARKFPYNACELICSGNKEILKLFFQFHDIVIEDDSEDESEESEESEKSKEEDSKEENKEESDKESKSEDDKEKKEEKEDDKEEEKEEKKDDKEGEKEEEKKEENEVKKEETQIEQQQQETQIVTEETETNANNEIKKEETQTEQQQEQVVIEEQTKEEEKKEQIEQTKDETQTEQTQEEPKTEPQITTEEQPKVDNNNNEQQQQQEPIVNTTSTNEQTPSQPETEPPTNDNNNKDSTDDKEDSTPKHPEDEESDSDSDSDSNSSSSKPKATKTRRKYPILEYFFDFLQSPNTSSNTNDVLSGYFYKILNHFLQKQGDSLLTFLFCPYSKKYLKHLIQNVTNRTASETMKSILTFSFSKHPELLPHRQTLCDLLLDELLQSTTDITHFTCIIDSFINSFKDKSFFLFFISEQPLLTKLFTYKLNKDQPRYVKSYINLIRKLYNTTLQQFPNRITTNNEYEPTREMTNFMDYIFSHFADEKPLNDDKDVPNCNETLLQSILAFIFNNIIDSKCALLQGFSDFDNVAEMQATYLQQQPKLGTDKLVQAEYLYTIIDLIVNATYIDVHKDLIMKVINILKEQKLLWIIHNIFFLFEFNNIYHNIYNNIFTVVLNQHTPKEVVDAFFVCEEDKTDLISFYIDNFITKYIFKFESERSVTTCCFAYEMKLLKDIMDSQNEHVKAYVQGHKLINGFNQLIAGDLNELYAQKFLLRESDAFQQEFGNFDEEKKVEFTKRNIYQLIEDNVKLFKEYKEKGNIEECLEIKEKMKKEEEEEERKQQEERLASSIVLDEDGIGGGDDDNEENKGSDPFPTFDDDREQEDDAVKEDDEGSGSRNFLKSSANFGLMDDFMGKEEGNENGDDNGSGDTDKVMEFPHVVSEEIVEKDIRGVNEEDGEKKEEVQVSEGNGEVGEDKKEDVIENTKQQEVSEDKKEEDVVIAEEKQEDVVMVEDKKEEELEDKQPEITTTEEKKEEVVAVEDKQPDVVVEEKKEEIIETTQPEIAEKKEEIIEETKPEVIEPKQPEEVEPKQPEIIEPKQPEIVEEKKE